MTVFDRTSAVRLGIAATALYLSHKDDHLFVDRPHCFEDWSIFCSPGVLGPKPLRAPPLLCCALDLRLYHSIFLIKNSHTIPYSGLIYL